MFDGCFGGRGRNKEAAGADAESQPVAESSKRKPHDLDADDQPSGRKRLYGKQCAARQENM